MDDETDISLAATLADKDAARHRIMEIVRAKYISSARDDEILKALAFLIERAISRTGPGMPTPGDFRPEGRAVVVTGNSGTGKTTTLRRTFLQHAAFPNFGTAGCPLISIRIPRPCTLKGVGRLLLAELGYPLRADKREYLVWEIARERLEMMKVVRFIHFDEIQNMTTTANALEAVRINDTFKSLLNDNRHPVSLILSGLPEIEGFLRADPQIRRRARFIRLAQLTTNDLDGMHKIVVVGLSQLANLTTEPNARTSVVPRLLHAAVYEMGIVIEIACDAIDEALRTGAKQLAIGHFATAYAKRTGSAASANPFLVSNWSVVDCEAVLADREGDLRHAMTSKAPVAASEDKTTRYKLVQRGDY